MTLKKKEIVISTVAVTTIMLMASVGYSCSRPKNEDVHQTVVEEQTEVETETALAPIVTSYNKEIDLNIGDTLTLEMLEVNVASDNGVNYDFKGKTYSKVGDFTEVVKVSDKITNAVTELTISVKVSDKSAPKILGTKDITITEGDRINLLSGVSASDNLDGDLTPSITVSKYNKSKLDSDQTVTYSVADKAGNTTTKNITLHIKSNPIESLDKTMYAISAVNVRNSSSANGDKIGSLGYAESVHVTGRDKNTGWYRIEFEGGSAFVSDSYLSDSKPVVQTPSNNNSSNTTKPSSDCTSSDCDCSSDCTPIRNCDLDNCTSGDCTSLGSVGDCGW